jgi:hypothetical protein
MHFQVYKIRNRSNVQVLFQSQLHRPGVLNKNPTFWLDVFRPPQNTFASK